MIIAWDVFLIDALKAGWKIDTICARVHDGLVDVYDKTRADTVVKMLRHLYESQANAS